jgi:hypothetical protein
MTGPVAGNGGAIPDLAQFLVARITEAELVARTSIDSGGRE